MTNIENPIRDEFVAHYGYAAFHKLTLINDVLKEMGIDIKKVNTEQIKKLLYDKEFNSG